MNQLEIHKDAQSYFNKNNFKKALDMYKILNKQYPSAEYQNNLGLCYIERAKELAAKNMYQEANTMWENHKQYCNNCTHARLHINWLLIMQKYITAAQMYCKYIDTMSKDEQFFIEEKFAALFLSDHNEEEITKLEEIFGEVSLLNKHKSFACNAINAFSLNQIEQLKTALDGISYRSPYKNLRIILKETLNERAVVTASSVANIPATSPFYELSKILCKQELAPHNLIWQALLSKKFIEAESLLYMNGGSKTLWKNLRSLLDVNAKLDAKKLLNIIVDEKNVIGLSRARRLCYSLALFDQSQLGLFENHFGKLTLLETAHFKSLRSMLNKNICPHCVWDQYANLLKKESKNEENNFEIALILRFNAKLCENDARDFHDDWQGFYISALEESVQFDPFSKDCYLNILKFYLNNGSKTQYTKWLKEAYKYFPEDKEILYLLFDNSRTKKTTLKQTLGIAEKLLILDTTNSNFKRCYLEEKLNQVRGLIKLDKFKQAKDILHELSTTKSWIQSSYSRLMKNVRCLIDYANGDLDIAKTTFADGNTNFLSQLQLLIEGLKFENLKYTEIIKDFNFTPLNKLRIENQEQLNSILECIKDTASQKFKQWNILSEWLKIIAQYVINGNLTNENEIVKVCEMFEKISCFTELYRIFKSSKKIMTQIHVSPLLAYYFLLAKIKMLGKHQLSSNDRSIFDKALNNATKNNMNHAIDLLNALQDKFFIGGGFDFSQFFDIFNQINK